MFTRQDSGDHSVCHFELVCFSLGFSDAPISLLKISTHGAIVFYDLQPCPLRRTINTPPCLPLFRRLARGGGHLRLFRFNPWAGRFGKKKKIAFCGSFTAVWPSLNNSESNGTLLNVSYAINITNKCVKHNNRMDRAELIAKSLRRYSTNSFLLRWVDLRSASVAKNLLVSCED